MDQAGTAARAPGLEVTTDGGAGGDAARLAAEVRTPLTPVVGLVEVFLRRWGDELTPAQVGLLHTVDREGRRILARLDAATVGGGEGPGALPGDRTRVTGPTPHVAAPTLEDHVIHPVAGLLRAQDDDQMLATLVALVDACGGRARPRGSNARAALRTMPDDLQVPDGREMTLGPVLRALAAAAIERASGDLAPPRRLEPGATSVAPVEQRETLVALDLGSLGAVRSEFGDPGARWLVEKLRRTLRSLLRAQDGALRYPASRFLVVLGATGPAQAGHFARRVAWEWDAYLGQRLTVRTQVEPIEHGDLDAGLRRLSAQPPI
jgi:hypothetical protein